MLKLVHSRHQDLETQKKHGGEIGIFDVDVETGNVVDVFSPGIIKSDTDYVQYRKIFLKNEYPIDLENIRMSLLNSGAAIIDCDIERDNNSVQKIDGSEGIVNVHQEPGVMWTYDWAKGGGYAGFFSSQSSSSTESSSSSTLASVTSSSSSSSTFAATSSSTTQSSRSSSSTDEDISSSSSSFPDNSSSTAGQSTSSQSSSTSSSTSTEVSLTSSTSSSQSSSTSSSTELLFSSQSSSLSSSELSLTSSTEQSLTSSSSSRSSSSSLSDSSSSSTFFFTSSTSESSVNSSSSSFSTSSSTSDSDVSSTSDSSTSISSSSTAALTTSSSSSVGDETVLLLHMDGANGGTTFVDNSFYQHVITPSGTANTATHSKQFGKSSLELDGSGAYLSVADNAVFTMTGDFTIDMFVWMNDFGEVHTFLSADTTNSNYLRIRWTVDENEWHILFKDSFDSLNFAFPDDGVIAHTWHHIALTRSGTDVRFYRDGNQIGTTKTDISGPTTIDPLNGWRVGQTHGGAPSALESVNGYIDELRIVNGTAFGSGSTFPVPSVPYTNFQDSSSSIELSGFSSSSSSTEQFTSSSSSSSTFSSQEFSSFTSSSSSSFEDTVLLLHFDGSHNGTVFVDNGCSNHTLTRVGSTAITSTEQKKFGKSSYYNDGSDSYLDLPADDDFNFSNNEFTFETFVRFVDVSTSSVIIASHTALSTAFLRVQWNSGGGGQWEILIDNNPTHTFSDTLSNDVWYHIALTKTGTQLRFYRDGTQLGTTELEPGNANSPNGLHIGRNHVGDGGGTALNGYLDELRFVKRAISEGPTYPVPTGPYKNCVDSSSSIEFSGFSSSSSSSFSSSTSLSSSSTENFSTSSTENLSSSSAVAPFAAEFSGAVNDDLSLFDNASISTGNIDFSWSCWVYFDVLANAGLVSKFVTAGTREYIIFYDHSLQRFQWFVSSNGTAFTSVTANSFGAPSAGTWYLITTWHDSVNNEIGIQINDGPVDTLGYASGVADTAAPFYLGRHGNSAFWINGRMSQVGFWKNRVLSASDRNQLWNGGVGYQHTDLPAGLTTSLESYWNLDELSGTRFDSEGSNNLSDNGVTRAAGPRANLDSSFSSSSDSSSSTVSSLSESSSSSSSISTHSSSSSLEMSGFSSSSSSSSSLEFDSFSSSSVSENLYAGSFSGGPAGSYLSRASNSDLQAGTGDFMVACWFRVDSAPVGAQGIVGKSMSGGDLEYNLITNGTSVSFNISAAGSSFTGVGENIELNTWYFVVGWYDDTGSTVNIQVNNGAENSTAFVGSQINNSNTEFRIGSDVQLLNRLDGAIARVGIWKGTNLTAVQRAKLWNSGCGFNYDDLPDNLRDNLTEWWDLDEASGTRFAKVNGNDLSDNGSVGQTDFVPACESSSSSFSSQTVDFSSSSISESFSSDAGNIAAYSPSLWVIGDEEVYHNEAGQIPEDGDTVERWVDFIDGVPQPIQETALNKPVYKKSVINGHDVIRFDPTADNKYLTVDGGLSFTECTVFMVIRVSQGKSGVPFGQQLPSGDNFDEAPSCRIFGSGVINVRWGSGAGLRFNETGTAVVNDDEFHLIAMRLGSTNGTWWVDGIEDANGAATGPILNSGSQDFWLGIHFNTFGNFSPFDGDIAEFALIPSLLSFDEIDAVSQDLSTKYDLQINSLSSQEFSSFSSSSSSQEFSSFSSSSSSSGPNSAAEFDGVDDFLSRASNASLNCGDIDFTFSAWVYFDTLPTVGTNAVIIGKNNGPANQRGYQLFYNSSFDRIRLCVSGDGLVGTQTCVDADSLGSPQTNTWYHVIGWHDSVNDIIGIQINDYDADTLAHTDGCFLNTSDFRVGSNGAGGNLLDGRVAMAGLWKNRILNREERNQLFNGGLGFIHEELPNSLVPNLESYWTLDEHSGTRFDGQGTNDLTDNGGVGFNFEPMADENSSGSSSSTIVSSSTTSSSQEFSSFSSSSFISFSSSSSSSTSISSSSSSSSVVPENAASFDGVNDELSVASNATLQTGDIDFTVAIWVYMDDKSSNRPMLAKWDFGSNDREYLIMYEIGMDRIAFFVSPDGTGPSQVQLDADTLGSPKTNTWYLVTAWHDSVNDELGIQINDASPDTVAHAAGVNAGNSFFAIGVDDPGNNRHDGRCCFAGLWKRVLTENERNELFNLGSGLKYSFLSAGLTTSLISYWNLSETSGTRFDSEGSNDLTQSGGVGTAGGPEPALDTSFSSSPTSESSSSSSTIALTSSSSSSNSSSSLSSSSSSLSSSSSSSTSISSSSSTSLSSSSSSSLSSSSTSSDSESESSLSSSSTSANSSSSTFYSLTSSSTIILDTSSSIPSSSSDRSFSTQSSASTSSSTAESYTSSSTSSSKEFSSYTSSSTEEVQSTSSAGTSSSTEQQSSSSSSSEQSETSSESSRSSSSLEFVSFSSSSSSSNSSSSSLNSSSSSSELEFTIQSLPSGSAIGLWLRMTVTPSDTYDADDFFTIYANPDQAGIEGVVNQEFRIHHTRVKHDIDAHQGIYLRNQTNFVRAHFQHLVDNEWYSGLQNAVYAAVVNGNKVLEFNGNTQDINVTRIDEVFHVELFAVPHFDFNIEQIDNEFTGADQQARIVFRVKRPDVFDVNTVRIKHDNASGSFIDLFDITLDPSTGLSSGRLYGSSGKLIGASEI